MNDRELVTAQLIRNTAILYMHTNITQKWLVWSVFNCFVFYMLANSHVYQRLHIEIPI